MIISVNVKSQKTKCLKLCIVTKRKNGIISFVVVEELDIQETTYNFEVER